MKIDVPTIHANSIVVMGSGLGYSAAQVVVNLYFKRRRNLALGIAISGVGAGLFVSAQVTQLSRDYYGTMGVFLIITAMAATMVTFGALCFPRNLELHSQKQR